MEFIICLPYDPDIHLELELNRWKHNNNINSN